jgi:hypothetical protein
MYIPPTAVMKVRMSIWVTLNENTNFFIMISTLLLDKYLNVTIFGFSGLLVMNHRNKAT